MKSKNRNFNKEYFNLWKELPLFVLCFIRSLFLKKKQNSKRILIVTPCLIGEFVAIIPAIFDYIERYKDYEIDILVTPQLEELARKIKGIKDVYVTSSVYERFEEKKITVTFPAYKATLCLRMSPQAYKIVKSLNTNTIFTFTTPILAYGLHLLLCLVKRTNPKRWRDVTFEILRGVDRKLPIDDMVILNKDSPINSLPGKKIVLHTTAHWENKNWSKNKWIELLTKINSLGNFSFIFIGGKEDMETYNHISKSVSFETYSLISKTNLSDTLSLMRDADYFIGIDSGPSNMAHLVGIRSITLVGVSPNMYISPHEEDITIDKTGKNNLLAMFLKLQHPPINRITADEVFIELDSWVHGT